MYAKYGLASSVLIEIEASLSRADVHLYHSNPIKMGDGEAPVVEEFKYLGSMLSKNFDDSVTIMARIRLARIAFTKLQKAIFGTRRVALESKKIAYESLVLSLLLYGSECWVVNAENMRLLQRFHRKCIRIMCRVTRHHTRKHHISTEELEAKLGIHDIRHYVHSRVLRYLGHVFRMDADRTPSLLQRCWVPVVDGKQPSGKTKVLYDSAVVQTLRVGSCLARWGSASFKLMPLTRASGIT